MRAWYKREIWVILLTLVFMLIIVLMMWTLLIGYKTLKIKVYKEIQDSGVGKHCASFLPWTH